MPGRSWLDTGLALDHRKRDRSRCGLLCVRHASTLGGCRSTAWTATLGVIGFEAVTSLAVGHGLRTAYPAYRPLRAGALSLLAKPSYHVPLRARAIGQQVRPNRIGCAPRSGAPSCSGNRRPSSFSLTRVWGFRCATAGCYRTRAFPRPATHSPYFRCTR